LLLRIDEVDAPIKRANEDPPRDASDGPMTGNPDGPMRLAENQLDRSHAHGRRHLSF
jgi:hypothetical protein